ncbi:MAG: hypothetical protein ACTSY1_04360, partial [Alphaproteobacteria bacterium]
HMNDGTFGITGECRQMDADIVERIEAHRFDAEHTLSWRNPALDFQSPAALVASLAVTPQGSNLVRSSRGSDQETLQYLVKHGDLAGLAGGPAAVRQLWEACQIPDYRKVGAGEHAKLVLRIFQALMSDQETLSEDWLAEQVAHSDRTDGDIDTLATRIAHIRTWTFVANKTTWLNNASHWQEKTREIEDKLSDALHERLTNRFIDRRTSVLMKKLKDKGHFEADIAPSGEIVAQGQYLGKIDGLRFVADPDAKQGADAKALRNAAMRVLAGELSGRVKRLVGEPDLAFATTENGYITWRGAPVAHLEGGDSALTPRLKLLADDELPAPDAEAARTRLQDWLKSHIQTVLEPLFALSNDEAVTGLARGIGFRLVENLGLLARDTVAGDVKQLDQPSRATMRRHGLRFGAFSLYFPALLKPQAAFLRLLLFQLAQEASTSTLRGDWPKPPVAGLTSLSVGPDAPTGFYQALGYRICGIRAVRADMLERLSDTIRPLIHWKSSQGKTERPEGAHPSGGFTVTPTMMSLVGCSGEEFAGIMTALGFRRTKIEPPKTLVDLAPTPTNPDSPPDQPESKAETTPAAPEEPDGPTPDEKSATEPPQEPVMIDLWRPRRAERPRRVEHPQRAERPQQDGHKTDAARQEKSGDTQHQAKGKSPAPRHKRQGSQRPGGKFDGKNRRSAAGPAKKDGANSRPRAKPMDPKDSPFAALLALKEQMAEGSETKTD